VAPSSIRMLAIEKSMDGGVELGCERLRLLC
jgi:hypothetical protein